MWLSRQPPRETLFFPSENRTVINNRGIHYRLHLTNNKKEQKNIYILFFIEC